MIITKTREISKEEYGKAMENGGRLTSEQELEILGGAYVYGAYVYGYGLYGTAVYQEDGKYMVSFRHGDSCD